MDKNGKSKASASQKGEDEALQHLGRELHAALFPEEYDYMYDSVSEAKDRQRGKNLLSAEYVGKTNTQHPLSRQASHAGSDRNKVGFGRRLRLWLEAIIGLGSESPSYIGRLGGAQSATGRSYTATHQQ